MPKSHPKTLRVPKRLPHPTSVSSAPDSCRQVAAVKGFCDNFWNLFCSVGKQSCPQAR